MEMVCAAALSLCFGFVLGHNHCWHRWVKPDVLGEGLRAQVKRIREQRRLVGLDGTWETISTAVIKVDEEQYEVAVTSKVRPEWLIP